MHISLVIAPGLVGGPVRWRHDLSFQIVPVDLHLVVRQIVHRVLQVAPVLVADEGVADVCVTSLLGDDDGAGTGHLADLSVLGKYSFELVFTVLCREA